MSLQFAMFQEKSDWVPPTELPDLSNAKEIAVDLETRDTNIKSLGPGWPRKDGYIIGFAVATSFWSGYLPIKHEGGGNLDSNIVKKFMQEVLSLPCPKVMHNAQYDLGWLKSEGFEVNGKIIDTMVVASLLDENRFSYSLNAVAFDYIEKIKSEKGLEQAAREFGLDPKADMWQMPPMFVGPYATADAEITLEVWECFKNLITKENLKTVFELERDLLPCLVDMTYRGIRIDLDRVEQTSQYIRKKEIQAVKKIKDLCGFEPEIWAAQSLAKAFDKLSIPYPKTEKNAPSFTKNFLQTTDHELAKSILQAREYNKTNGTFINGLLKYVDDKGRIHGHINQIRSDDGGTVSGRISMNNPNLQQIPARHEELGPMIRSVFMPEEGEKWASIDYSQQEPRILVHFASALQGGKSGRIMQGVDDFVNGYINDPDMDFHSMVAEMADIPRKSAKVLNLALMYGMGVAKMSNQLDVSLEEAKELTAQYHERVPFVKKTMDIVSQTLQDNKRNGYIVSILGRKLRFNLFEPTSFGVHKAMGYEEARAHYGDHTALKRAYTYKALNRLIQASAADMTKKAMSDLYNEHKIIPLLQIHDELAISVKDKSQAKGIANIMENTVQLKVPMKTDLEIGLSWGEAK